MITKLCLIISCALVFSGVVHAEKYQGPKFELKEYKPHHYQVKKSQVEDSDNYKIMDRMEADRNVASEEDSKPSRDPSSKDKKEENSDDNDSGPKTEPRPWHIDR